ncbi:hypothetical protein BC827DRAFT_1156244 [Russula dissimulans]|nr:hypothetical protein BC827DRAFT_1156244 [Russula dissimulans]
MGHIPEIIVGASGTHPEIKTDPPRVSGVMWEAQARVARAQPTNHTKGHLGTHKFAIAHYNYNFPTKLDAFGWFLHKVQRLLSGAVYYYDCLMVWVPIPTGTGDHLGTHAKPILNLRVYGLDTLSSGPFLANGITMPTTPLGPRKRKLAARLADQDNVAQPVLKQQRVALQQHCEANNTSTSNNVSSDDGPPRGQVTHQPNPKPHLEVVDSTDDESDSSDNDSDILKEFVPKSTGQKRGEAAREAETETPEQECVDEDMGHTCICVL